MVLQQATGNGIFDGNNAQQLRVVGQSLKQIPESHTGNNLYFLLLKKLTGGNFVIRTTYTLNRDSFHIKQMFFRTSDIIKLKNPAGKVPAGFEYRYL
jgi:hypothetical protein